MSSMLRSEDAAVDVHLTSQSSQSGCMPEARDGIQAAGGQDHCPTGKIMMPQSDCPGGSVAIDISMPWRQSLEMSEIASVSTSDIMN